MRSWIARRLIARFEKHYAYDAAYMRWMLDVSPAAFFKFVSATRLTQHRNAAPVSAYYVAKLLGVMEEDCGPCVQLVVDAAREAKVPDTDLDAALRRDPRTMSEDAALAFRFADAVLRRNGKEEAARDAVRARWGDKGVVDLTLAVQTSRLFPMLKAGFGFAQTCSKARIGDRDVAVARAA